mmetsp:Transcript_392/g.773  ORF Transcript_392/g.773 Transcript_392/m.773 type:complete len:99 (+) Transcript_392:70-366(+)
MGSNHARIETTVEPRTRCPSATQFPGEETQIENEVVLARVESVEKEYASKKFNSNILSARIRCVHGRTRPKWGINWGYRKQRLWVDSGLQATFLVTLE